MEWIKSIISSHTDEEGKIDIEAASAAIDKAFPRYAVPKSDFNAKSQALTEAQAALDGYKDTEQKIADLTAERDNATAALASYKKSATIQRILTESGCLDPDYVIYKAGGLDKIELDEAGALKDAEKTIAAWREAAPVAFGSGKETSGYAPKGGQNPPEKNPFSAGSLNLSEQGRLYRENPAEARRLAAEAGIKI